MRPHQAAARIRLGLAAAAGLLLLLALASFGDLSAPAAAHGKELDIAVAPLRPDPARPLVRLYHVTVTFRGDGDPVEGADVELSAIRRELGQTIEPVRLTGIDGRAGLYAGELDYPRFGSWDVTLTVSAALGQGEGEVTFTDEVRPIELSLSEEERRKADADRVIRLQAFFGFDWWPDIVNIAARVTHSVAGLAYFGATSLVLLLAWAGVGAEQSALVLRPRRWFLPTIATSLALLLVAGVYSAIFDAPVLAPGLLDFDAMLRLPYGEWYLAAFAVKPAIFVAIAVLAVRIHGGLRRLHPPVGGAASVREGVMAQLRRDTALNAALGLLLVVDLAVVIYLHYVSHLGVLLPE